MWGRVVVNELLRCACYGDRVRNAGLLLITTLAVAAGTPDALAKPVKHKPVATVVVPAGKGTTTTAAVDAALAKLTDDPITGKADRVNGVERKHMVAFTFDDGPNPETTPHVIETLKAYDIPATFFIVTQRLAGARGEKPRALIKQMLADGFLVGDHTTSHASLPGKPPAKLVFEIDNSIRALGDATQQPFGLFRAPYGALDARGRAWIRTRGLTEVFWSVDTLDWKAKRADRLRAKTGKMILAGDGGIVLMHDIHALTASVVPGVLDDLEAENCRRLTAHDPKQPPIIPVSLHYFLRDHKSLRPVPAAVQARTDHYLAALPTRCAKRPPIAASPAAAAGPITAPPP